MGGAWNLGEEGDFTWESSDEAPPIVSLEYSVILVGVASK